MYLTLKNNLKVFFIHFCSFDAVFYNFLSMMLKREYEIHSLLQNETSCLYGLVSFVTSTLARAVYVSKKPMLLFALLPLEFFFLL
jgi:hypothetical protein